MSGRLRSRHCSKREHRVAPRRQASLLRDAVLQLVRALLGSEHPDRFARRLWQATGGNPFDVTDDYRELPIPASVHAAVAARITPARRLRVKRRGVQPPSPT